MVTKPTSKEALENIDRTKNCISQFFRPKPQHICDKGADRLRTEEENNVVVLDDDSDDDLDGNNFGIVDLTEGRESEIFRTERSQALEIDDNDEHDDNQSSDLMKKRTDEDVVQDDETKKRDNLNPHYETVFKPSDTQQNSNTNKDIIPSPQKSSIVVKNNKENPFAKFAFGASSTASESRFVNTSRTTWQRHYSSSTKNKRANSDGNNDGDNHDTKKIRASSKNEKKEKEFVKIRDISPEEQIKIIRKWHSMADPLASLEVRRYQVLLAARLHARCQEITVRKAVLKLREHFASLSETKTITVDEMAKSDPEELAIHISSLQFYNVKAKQIVKAAQEIQSRHGGIVPEDEFSLLQITGIGKTFADLLAFVNTREAHERVIS
jgi:endonuclease III